MFNDQDDHDLKGIWDQNLDIIMLVMVDVNTRMVIMNVYILVNNNQSSVVPYVYNEIHYGSNFFMFMHM